MAESNMTGQLALPDPPPAFMTLEVTKQCNYRCPFCYCFWHESPELAGPELDTAGWKRLIECCIRKGAKNLLFSGGEALLRNDIRDLLDYAVRTGPQTDVSLFTNGSLMDESMILFCKERRIHISTSLQGLRTHAAMTGTGTGYRKTLELISLGHQEEWPVAVSIVVMQGNKGEIRDVFAAAALCGASHIQLGPMMPEGRGVKHLDWTLSLEEWNAVKEEIRSMKDFGVPYVFCDEMICACRSHAPEIAERFSAMKKGPCEAGKTFGVIGPDGQYRKCIHCYPEMKPTP